MSHPPHDEKELISFIQRYRPSPPPAKSTCEQQLFSRIIHESQHCQQRRLKWLIPSAIAATCMTILGGYNLLQPSPYEQFVMESTELTTTELEDFMINTWQETTYVSTGETLSEPVYSQWLSLGNLEPQYLISSP
ncbi:MAG: hypothetical protein AAGF26_03710 [Cyanobacteria bacterium P01_G01_bin.49]